MESLVSTKSCPTPRLLPASFLMPNDYFYLLILPSEIYPLKAFLIPVNAIQKGDYDALYGLHYHAFKYHTSPSLFHWITFSQSMRMWQQIKRRWLQQMVDVMQISTFGILNNVTVVLEPRLPNHPAESGSIVGHAKDSTPPLQQHTGASTEETIALPSSPSH